jgi:phage terminase Nu1 subunit (DNA packaging protein)
MTGNVVHLNRSAPGRLLSKKHLAAELGRSPRWVELRMREGLPVEPRRTPAEHTRFDLTRVQAWLVERAEQPATLEQRVIQLERQVAALTRLIGGH